MFKTLDRYILKEIASPFSVGLIVYTFTLLINNILLLSHTLVAKAASGKTIALILVYLLPDLLAFTVPMASLMGILAGLSRMSSDSEIVAYKTMGINNSRLLKPVMVFSVLTWVFSSILIMFLAPEANFRLNKLLTQVGISKTVSNIKPRTFYRDFPFMVMYFNNISDKTGEWENIFIYSMKQGDTDNIVLADSGKFIQNPKNSDNYLILKNARVHSYKKKEPEQTYSLTRYSLLKEDVTSNINIKFNRKSHQLVFPQLVKKRSERPGDLLLNMEYHRKFALPFTCLAFGFLALSLGISTRRGGKVSGFIISLLIIFLYYTLSTTARSLILKRTLPPGIGMWSANIFLILTGLVFFNISSKEKSLDLRWFHELSEKFRKTFSSKTRQPLLILKVQRFRIRLIRQIDRYVSKRIFLIFMFVFCSLMLVFFIIGIVELVDDIVDNKVPFSFALKYVFYNSPSIASFAVPVSLLTAVLLGFSWMSKHNEVIAVQISGTSLYRLALPAVFIGLIISAVSFYVQEEITPQANIKARKTLNIIHNRKMPDQLELQKNWVYGKNNSVYFYSGYNRKTRRFSKFNAVSITDGFAIKKRYAAARARWLDSHHLELQEGFVRFYRNSLPVRYLAFHKKTIVIPEGKEYFKKRVAYTQDMNIRDLQAYIRYLKTNNASTQRYEAQLYYKFAFPLSSLIMVLIAIPFSFMMGNRGTVYGIGIAIGISIVFWGAIGIFSSLGGTGLLSPFISAFAPIFIFAAVSVWMFMHVRT